LIWVLAADGFNVRHRSPLVTGVYNPERLRSAGFWEAGDDEASLEFVHRYSRMTGHIPTAGDAMEYDAFMLLRAAIMEVGANREAVRNWLASLGRTRPAWQGVTGPISFDRPRAGILRMFTPVPVPE
jgi:ABC-type branched-subunit amino acid transport system substrate-binding protein